MRHTKAVVLLLVLNGCALSAATAHGADIGTTVYALHQGMHEENPLLGREPTVVSLAAAKAGFLLLAWAATELDEEHKGTIWTIATLLGLAPAVVNSWRLMK